MPYTVGQQIPLQQAVGGIMRTPPLPQGAMTAQAAGGLQPPPNMDKLVQALMQAKMKNLLAGKLPGTTPQTLGLGTAGSDAATGPQAQGLSLGGSPTSMDA